jgi:PPE-repeat protein
MDFALLPPEINSGLMYAGPGPESMLAAAAAWDGLASELNSAAAGYGSVVSGLTAGPWQGPASAAMAAAAAPYVGWMSTTAAQAEQTAAQAQAAAAAYETAFAATVPPEVIAANRAQLMALIATNSLGQNTPAIMATQAQYLEMWAQDAATMYGYAGASAAATELPTFSPAPQTTTGAAVGGPLAATAKAAGASGAQTLSAVPSALQSLATPLASTTASTASKTTASTASTSSSSLTDILGQLGLPTNWSTFLGQTNQIGGLGSDAINGTSMASWVSLGHAMMTPAKAAAGAAPAFPPGVFPGLPGFAGAGLGGGGPVSAGLGNAGSVGALSVPRSWAAAVPAVTKPVTALPETVPSAAPPAEGPADMLGGVPLVGGLGRGFAGGPAPRYGFQLSVVPHPPAAG